MIPFVLPDPISVDRDTARREAQRELSKRIYHRDDEPLALRLTKAVFRHLERVIDRAANATPGGYVGLVLIVIAIAVLVVVLRWRLGPLGRTGHSPSALFGDVTLDAAEHRRRADDHAAAGAYAEAVRERLRAIVRELEQRSVIEPRNGRTADEAAREAGVVIRELADRLLEGARLFDEVWYGGRTADAAADDRLRQLDVDVQRARIPLTVAP